MNTYRIVRHDETHIDCEKFFAEEFDVYEEWGTWAVVACSLDFNGHGAGLPETPNLSDDMEKGTFIVEETK